MSTVLVVGARKDSIGKAIVCQARAMGYHVMTAGIGDEEVEMDVVQDALGALSGRLAMIQPQYVVCTVGLNNPGDGTEPDPLRLYREHYDANVIGPMRLLVAWQYLLAEEDNEKNLYHFVAISSNSARVPRSNSAPYCSSKAALSQALRVKAREGRGSNLVVYGYEPGLVQGTPMTAQTAQNWPGQPLTRMRDPRLAEGIPAANLAWLVVQGLTMGHEMNGLLIPLDADES